MRGGRVGGDKLETAGSTRNNVGAAPDRCFRCPAARIGIDCVSGMSRWTYFPSGCIQSDTLFLFSTLLYVYMIVSVVFTCVTKTRRAHAGFVRRCGGLHENIHHVPLRLEGQHGGHLGQGKRAGDRCQRLRHGELLLHTRNILLLHQR